MPVEGAMVDVVEQDVPCQKCGYNLRTLGQGAVCPECAEPVAGSVERHRTTEGWNLRRLAMGFLLVAAYPFLPGFRRVVPVASNQPLRHAFLSLAEPLAAGLLLAAVLLIARSGPASSRRGWRRRVGIDAALALLMVQIVGYAFIHGTVLIRWHFGLGYRYPGVTLYDMVPYITNLVAQFLQIVLLVAGVVVLHRVPRVLQRSWVGPLATACLAAVAAATAFHALYFAVVLDQWWHFSHYVNALVNRLGWWESPMAYFQWIVHWAFWCFMAHWAMSARSTRSTGLAEISARGG
jgi:hypothetical protein